MTVGIGSCEEIAMALPPETDAVLTPAEAGAMLRVNPRTVIGWSRTGKLRTVYSANGRRLFSRADVLALIAIPFN